MRKQSMSDISSHGKGHFFESAPLMRFPATLPFPFPDMSMNASIESGGSEPLTYDRSITTPKPHRSTIKVKRRKSIQN
jgi:hypothetical protein